MSKKEEKNIEINEKYIKWFSDISKKDVKLVGGKGANLGEMSRIKIPVPPGFVITSEAYKYFLFSTGLDKEIYRILSKIEEEKTKELEESSKRIRQLIESKELPDDLKQEIIEAYEILSSKNEDTANASKEARTILQTSKEQIFVAVRSSATAEDSDAASFAGQQETFVNIKGKENLISSVKKCFSSLFTPRSIYYRIKKGFRHEDVLNAVIIQEMINSDKSGVIFSKDPVKQTDSIIVEAVFGLGEGIVSGRINPDSYAVDRELKITSRKISLKKEAVVRSSSGETNIVKLTADRAKSQVLTDYEIKKLADYAIKLEEHYKSPQDIEFAIDAGEIHIVQTRPITTLKKKSAHEEISGKIIIEGQPASPGIGSGEVKLILDLKDLNKIKKGDILVTKMTNPDMVVTMQKSSAIITDEGGMTSHAAIVSREMGIPAVVGTGNATEKLKDGMILTVDGFNGKVYEGELEELKDKQVEILPVVKTETKIKVIVDLPSFAERAAKTHCREVGLIRIEGIIAESGKHPFYYLKHGNIEDYEWIIYNGIEKIARHFDELWIRTSDIRTDEYSSLEGAPEEKEQNPMLGMHGIRAGLKHKKILESELKAMIKLSKIKKIGVIISQLISVDELKKVKEALKNLSPVIPKNLKIGVMIETPASVQIIEELCKEGIDFISFGTNDLTQFTFAIDRNNPDVQFMFNETSPAILRQISFVMKTCKKYKVETSICGQAGSDKKMVEFLVKNGIDSISVNADKAKEISEFVLELEKNGMRGIDSESSEQKTNELKQEPQQLTEHEKHIAIEKEKQEWEDTDFGIDIFQSQNSIENNINPENYDEEMKKEKKQVKSENTGEKEQELQPGKENIIILKPKTVDEHGNVIKEKELTEEEKQKAQEVIEKIKEKLQEMKNQQGSGNELEQQPQSPNPLQQLQEQQQEEAVKEVETKIISKEKKIIDDEINMGDVHDKDIAKVVEEKSPMDKLAEKMQQETVEKQMMKKGKKPAGEDILDIF